MTASLFPVLYCGSIGYFQALMRADRIVFEGCENFPKQTHRNRMNIMGPNGVQLLVVPVVRRGGRQRMTDVQISYAENWRKDHWKSLEAAYRRSPYFEFYEDRFRPIYQKEHASLIELNLELLAIIFELLDVLLDYSFTTEYVTAPVNDFRHATFEWAGATPYLQVFANRHPFAPNLSILDPLFNLGPKTLALLQKPS